MSKAFITWIIMCSFVEICLHIWMQISGERVQGFVRVKPTQLERSASTLSSVPHSHRPVWIPKFKGTVTEPLVPHLSPLAPSPLLSLSVISADEWGFACGF